MRLIAKAAVTLRKQHMKLFCGIIIIIKILILYLSICTEIITINIEILHYYHIYQIFYVLKAVPVNQNKLI